MKTFYRLTHPDYDTGVQAVEKVVVRMDGTNHFEKLAKIVAPDLKTFRKEYPGTAVQGELQEEDVKGILPTMSDEQLAALGLKRSTSVEGSDGLFASEAAAELAKELDPDLFVAGEGSGKDGTYTASDVRKVMELFPS